MASPFPGMDPYLEGQGLWPDFHVRFINCWADALAERLPDNYDARLEERVYILELPGDEATLVRPDVTIAASESIDRSAERVSSDVATLEPITVPHCLIEEVTEPLIRILHRPDQTVVAILELLSPSNKSSSGRGVYLEKRGAILGQTVHLVELDLLLDGDRLPMRKPLPPGHYYAIVSHAERRPDGDVYAWTVRDALPRIPIPLLAGDPHIMIDLAEVFAVAYRRGRYERACDYTKPFAGPLNSAERKWVTNRARHVI